MVDDFKNLIRARWQEMVLIAGFMAIGMFLQELVFAEMKLIQASVSESGMANASGNMQQTTFSLFIVVMMVFKILSLLLLLGFLGTININYPTALDPIVLIRIGTRFFWRFIRFELLFELYFWAASGLLFSAVSFLFFPSVAPENIPVWVLLICGGIAISVLAKPLLLIPAIMICRNCMVLPAAAAMPKYKISEMRILAIVLVTGLSIAGAITAAYTNMDSNTVLFKVAIASKAIIVGVFLLVIGAMGIWFIGGGRFGVMEEMAEEETA